MLTLEGISRFYNYLLAASRIPNKPHLEHIERVLESYKAFLFSVLDPDIQFSETRLNSLQRSIQFLATKNFFNAENIDLVSIIDDLSSNGANFRKLAQNNNAEDMLAFCNDLHTNYLNSKQLNTKAHKPIAMKTGIPSEMQQYISSAADTQTTAENNPVIYDPLTLQNTTQNKLKLDAARLLSSAWNNYYQKKYNDCYLDAFQAKEAYEKLFTLAIQERDINSTNYLNNKYAAEYINLLSDYELSYQSIINTEPTLPAWFKYQMMLVTLGWIPEYLQTVDLHSKVEASLITMLLKNINSNPLTVILEVDSLLSVIQSQARYRQQDNNFVDVMRLYKISAALHFTNGLLISDFESAKTYFNLAKNEYSLVNQQKVKSLEVFQNLTPLFATISTNVDNSKWLRNANQSPSESSISTNNIFASNKRSTQTTESEEKKSNKKIKSSKLK